MARKYMNLQEVVKAIQDKRTLGKVRFNPNLEAEWASFVDDDNNQQKGSAIELIVFLYHKFCAYAGDEHWIPLMEGSLQPIDNIGDVRLAIRGSDAISSPDAILRCGDRYKLVSCKWNKHTFNLGEGAKLESFANARLKGKNVCYSLASWSNTLVTGNTNQVSKNLGLFRGNVFDRSKLARMWSDICIFMQKNDNSFANIQNSNRVEYGPKDEIQRWILNECESKLREHNTIALNAIMRTGKSVICALLAARMAEHSSVHRVIFVSHFPTDTFGELKSMFTKATQFIGYDIICSTDYKTAALIEKLSTSKKYILILSAAKGKTSSALQAYLSSVKFHFGIYDEAHYGSTAPGFLELKETIVADYTLYMSGTLDNFIVNNTELNHDAVVEWTYLDNMRCKRGFNIKLGKSSAANPFYLPMKDEGKYPTLNIHHMNPDLEVTGKLASLENEDFASTWPKIYANPGLLYKYVELILGDATINHRDALTKAYGNIPPAVNGYPKMIVWFCPDTASQVQLEATANAFYAANPGLKRRVRRFDSSNETGKFKDEILRIENDPDNLYLLILCGQGTTGITYKDLPVVIIGMDCDSITKWLQICFRCMTGGKKQRRVVYDLSTGHTFANNIHGFVAANTRNLEGKDLVKCQKEMLACVKITDGSFGTWDLEKLQTEYRAAQVRNPDALMRNAISYLDEIELIDALGLDTDSLSLSGKSIQDAFLVGEQVKGKTFVSGTKSTSKNLDSTEKKLLEIQEKERNIKMILTKLLFKTAIAYV